MHFIRLQAIIGFLTLAPLALTATCGAGKQNPPEDRGLWAYWTDINGRDNKEGFCFYGELCANTPTRENYHLKGMKWRPTPPHTCFVFPLPDCQGPVTILKGPTDKAEYVEGGVASWHCHDGRGWRAFAA